MLDQFGGQNHADFREGKDQEGSGLMNSRPKQNPLRERTIAGMRDAVGISNSTSSRSPGFRRMPAYKVMPPWLISVPRPSTTVVENPLDVNTFTGRSTGIRSQRRVGAEFDIAVAMIVFLLRACKLLK